MRTSSLRSRDHGIELRLVRLNIRFREDISIAWNGCVEIQPQDARQNVGPIGSAATACVIDQRTGLAGGDYIADRDHLQIGEIHDCVSAGMSAAEVVQFNLDVAEFERVFGARIGDAGRRGFGIRLRR